MLESYNTPDLYLAAFLKTIGYNMSNTKVQGKRLLFYFKDENSENIEETNKKLEQLEDSYFKGDNSTSIIALQFSNNVKSLKTLCHSILKRNTDQIDADR